MKITELETLWVCVEKVIVPEGVMPCWPSLDEAEECLANFPQRFPFDHNPPKGWLLKNKSKPEFFRGCTLHQVAEAQLKLGVGTLVLLNSDTNILDIVEYGGYVSDPVDAIELDAYSRANDSGMTVTFPKPKHGG